MEYESVRILLAVAPRSQIPRRAGFRDPIIWNNSSKSMYLPTNRSWRELLTAICWACSCLNCNGWIEGENSTRVRSKWEVEVCGSLASTTTQRVWRTVHISWKEFFASILVSAGCRPCISTKTMDIPSTQDLTLGAHSFYFWPYKLWRKQPKAMAYPTMILAQCKPTARVSSGVLSSLPPRFSTQTGQSPYTDTRGSFGIFHDDSDEEIQPIVINMRTSSLQ